MIIDKKNQEKSNRILELYMFVNPLGTKCLKAEKQVLKLIENHEGKLHFRILPFLNLQTTANYMKNSNIDASEQQNVFQNLYQAALAFKAAELQGKKKARGFLMSLQQEVSVNQKDFSHSLLTHLAESANLDVDMFLYDMNSDRVKKLFEADQKMAHEMNVTSNPAAVLFDTEYANYGLLIEDCLSANALEKVYREMTSTVQHTNILKSSNLAVKNAVEPFLRTL